MRKLSYTQAIAFVLIVAGLVVPSEVILSLLRGPSVAGYSSELHTGAVIFRASLVATAVYIFFLRSIPVWSRREYISDPLPGQADASGPAAIAAILAVSLALRLYDLGDGLWYDEILSYVNYGDMPLGEIVSTYDSQNQHMLFTILARISFAVFGPGAWALRLPAALFGVGSIAALYLLGRQVTDRRESLLACALMAVSYHHIWFSQNGRGYTGLLFWTLLTSWLLMRALREENARLWVAYALTSALGIYTHMTMPFVVLSHFLVLIYHNMLAGGRLRSSLAEGFLIGFCLSAFVTVLLYSLVIPQIVGGPAVWEGATSTVAEWKNPLWTILELARGMRLGFAGAAAAVAALILVGAGFISYLRTSPKLILLFVLPVVISVAAVKTMGHPVWPRLFFFTMGFGALILMRGTMKVAEQATVLVRLHPSRVRGFATAAGVALVVLSALSVPRAYSPKQDYAGALDYITANVRTGDEVVTVGVTSTFPYQKLFNTGWQPVETTGELESVMTRSERTWVVYTTPMYLDTAYPALMETIRRDFTHVRSFYGTLGDGTVYISMADSGAATNTDAGSTTEGGR